MINQNKIDGYLANFRRVFWPIEPHENKKFIPMALMMAFILFNYASFRAIKDGLVVTHIGPEAISFLKTYFVLPTAVIFMIIYTKLCNRMSQTKVFYTITLFFISYFVLYTFVLYPNPDVFHLSDETILSLSNKYPAFKWFIKIIGKWSYASFYIMAEMWGSLMLSLLFWQFANQVTKTQEAKRFYAMFGLFGNSSLPVVALMFHLLLGQNTHIVPDNIKLIPVLSITLLSSCLIIFLYRWINNNVLTDSKLCNPKEVKALKKKEKLSLGQSFKMIFTSRYLGLLVILVISYGISINLVEVVWKSKIKELYPTVEAYTSFMGLFQAYQGVASIILMFIGSNIIRRVSWSTAAALTPAMIMITGLSFFSFIIFDSSLGLYVAASIGTNPLVMVVFIGTCQNVLSKGVKYTLFDSTKEMAYIPLDDEMKTKGKAAVDVIGGRFGKSGGGIIQSSVFMLFPACTFTQATPLFATVFMVVLILWGLSIKALSKEYNTKIAEHEAAELQEAV